MNTVLRSTVAAVLLLCASAMAMTISDLAPGKAANGKDFQPTDLKGKVVFVAYWGMDCPHCIAEIPQWREIYSKYHNDGFEIIGMERHRFSESSISSLAKSRGIDFTLTTGGQLNGAVVYTIPHGFLFGPDGNLVQENPYDLESKVASLIKSAQAAKAVSPPAPKPEPAAPTATAIAQNTVKESAPKAPVIEQPAVAKQPIRIIANKFDESLVALVKFEKLAQHGTCIELAKDGSDEVANGCECPGSAAYDVTVFGGFHFQIKPCANKCPAEKVQIAAEK